MRNKYDHDNAILLKIKNNDRLIIEEIFHKYQLPFVRFIMEKKIDKDSALDIYYRSFTIFYYNAIEGKIAPPLKSSIKTYLHSIGKNVLLQYWTDAQKTKTEFIENAINFTVDFREPGIYDVFYHQNNKKVVEQLMLSLDDSCRKILELSFIKNYSDNAIMHELGLPNENAVRQKKFRCLTKARELMKSKKPNQ